MNRCPEIVYLYNERGALEHPLDEESYKKTVEVLRKRNMFALDCSVPFTYYGYEDFEFIDFVQATAMDIDIEGKPLKDHYDETGGREIRFKDAPAVLLYQKERKEFIVAILDYLLVQAAPLFSS